MPTMIRGPCNQSITGSHAHQIQWNEAMDRITFIRWKMNQFFEARFEPYVFLVIISSVPSILGYPVNLGVYNNVLTPPALHAKVLKNLMQYGTSSNVQRYITPGCGMRNRMESTESKIFGPGRWDQKKWVQLCHIHEFLIRLQKKIYRPKGCAPWPPRPSSRCTT